MARQVSFYLCAARTAANIIKEMLEGEAAEPVKSRIVEELLVERRCGCPRLVARNYYYRPLEEVLKSLGLCVVVVEASVEHRLLVGVGSGVFKASLEVGLTWDPVLDLPVIPGSAVKGAVRSFLLSHVAEKGGDCLAAVLELLGTGPRALPVDELRALGFEGNVEVEAPAAGLAMFFDAYPVAPPSGSDCILEPDVVTPHYYRRGKVLGDELEAMPSPVPHLAIAKGTPFRFIAASHPLPESLIEKLTRCLGVGAADTCGLLTWAIMETLRSHGLGARTGRGYGYFTSLVRIYVHHPTRGGRSPARVKLVGRSRS